MELSGYTPCSSELIWYHNLVQLIHNTNTYNEY